MDPDLLLIFSFVGGTAVALGGMTLLGLRMWLRRLPRTDARELAAIREELRQSIYEELASALEARDREIDELHERLDFTERLLARSRLPQRSEPSDSSPA